MRDMSTGNAERWLLYASLPHEQGYPSVIYTALWNDGSPTTVTENAGKTDYPVPMGFNDRRGAVWTTLAVPEAITQSFVLLKPDGMKKIQYVPWGVKSQSAIQLAAFDSELSVTVSTDGDIQAYELDRNVDGPQEMAWSRAEGLTRAKNHLWVDLPKSGLDPSRLYLEAADRSV